MRHITLLATLVISLHLTAACPNPALKLHTAATFSPPDSAYVLTKEQAVQNNNGKAINVHQGDDILIQLQSNPGGTGFSWQFVNELAHKLALPEHHDIQVGR